MGFICKLLNVYALLFHRAEHREYLASWNELKKARAVLSEVSAQEEFARWARQQRTVDKLQAEYERLGIVRYALLTSREKQTAHVAREEDRTCTGD